MAYDKGRYGGLPDAYGRTGPSQTLTSGEIQRLRQQLTQNPTQSVTLPTITATTSNLALPSNALQVRIATDGSPRSIDGFANVWEGRVVYIQNVGAATLTLVEANGSSSSAEHRIVTPGDVNIVLTLAGLAILIYDGVTKRWVLAGKTT